jgi:hypothetical protein
MSGVRIVKNKGCEVIGIGQVCDAVAARKDNVDGFKVFHHSGWWWIPGDYAMVCTIIEGEQ